GGRTEDEPGAEEALEEARELLEKALGDLDVSALADALHRVGEGYPAGLPLREERVADRVQDEHGHLVIGAPIKAELAALGDVLLPPYVDAMCHGDEHVRRVQERRALEREL